MKFGKKQVVHAPSKIFSSIQRVRTKRPDRTVAAKEILSGGSKMHKLQRAASSMEQRMEAAEQHRLKVNERFKLDR
jgi:hypothetical protein